MQSYWEALADRPIFHTARLTLRRPTEEDAPAIIAIASDWEVASRLARMPHPYGSENAKFFLTEIVPVELVWVIVERLSGQLVGVIGLAPREGADDRIELGYYIARTHWARGIATEAASVVVAYGVGLVGRERMAACFFADNPASGRVLEKLGFVARGRSERLCAATGTIKPLVKMSLTEAPVQEPA